METSDVVLRFLESVGSRRESDFYLALFRAGYAWSRQIEGLGLGDVKLGAAIGAWLPHEAIPWCFGLATSGALLAVMLARLSGEPVMRTTKIPFGAFLCPALWIAFYADSLTR